jgi:iron complex outermembrane receptor protein
MLTAVLTGCTYQAKQMLRALDEQGVGMIIDNKGEVTSYNAPGVEDLLYLTANEPERLQGAVVADRRVGKAAASLLITGKVKKVCTPLLSTPARKMLEEAGIPVYAREEIPLMVNRDGTDLCPMEKKLMDTETPEACVILLRGGSPVGIQMLEMLNQQGLSLLVYNDSTLTTHNDRGVRDLLNLLSEQPERLRGAIVADKLVGKSAAAIIAAGGVVEVHTNLICTPGRELLEKAGIKVFAKEEVPQILNRDRSGQCPFDTQLNDIESIEECVKILQNKPSRL